MAGPSSVQELIDQGASAGEALTHVIILLSNTLPPQITNDTQTQGGAGRKPKTQQPEPDTWVALPPEPVSKQSALVARLSHTHTRMPTYRTTFLCADDKNLACAA